MTQTERGSGLQYDASAGNLARQIAVFQPSDAELSEALKVAPNGQAFVAGERDGNILNRGLITRWCRVVDMAPGEIRWVAVRCQQLLDFLFALHRDGVHPAFAHPALTAKRSHHVLSGRHNLNHAIRCDRQTDVRHGAQ